MFKKALLVAFLVSACGTDGKDGAQGPAGKNGVNGVDSGGFDKKIFCNGVVNSPGSLWNGVGVTYDIVITNGGDILATASLDQHGSFSNTGTAFYGSTQVGADNGRVTVNIDSSNYAQIEYNSSINNIQLKIFSTNGNNLTVNNTNACTIYDLN